MMAMANGHDVPDDDALMNEFKEEDENALPPELLAMEREYQKRKAEKEAKSGVYGEDGMGIGYATPEMLKDLGLGV